MSDQEKFGGNKSDRTEEMAYPDKRLRLVLEGMKELFGELQDQIDSGKLTPEQCSAIEHKCRILSIEIANEGLNPSKIFKPKP